MRFRQCLILTTMTIAYGAVISCQYLSAADVNVRAGNTKPKANRPVTSIDLVVGPNTTVTPPAGWTLSRTSGNWRRYTGNLPVGATTGNWNGHNPTGTANAVIAAFDYGNGDTVSVCPDPVSAIAIPGGPSGTSFLGYNIPANQWGYFYEIWNMADFTDSTLST